MFIFQQNLSGHSLRGAQLRGSGQTMGGIGSFFKKIVKTVAPIAAGFIPGVGSFASAGVDAIIGGMGAGGGLAKGLGPITAYCGQVNSALDQLAGALTAENAQEVVSNAQQLAATLSDSSRVYQPKKGKDAEALANGKSQAAAKVQQIQAAAAAMIQQAQQQQQQEASAGNNNGGGNNGGGGSSGGGNNGGNNNGGSNSNGFFNTNNGGSNGDGGGIDTNQILIFGGLGLAAILLLRR